MRQVGAHSLARIEARNSAVGFVITPHFGQGASPHFTSCNEDVDLWFARRAEDRCRICPVSS